MSDPDTKEELDSFDKLLLELSKKGFSLPFAVYVRDHQSLFKADKEAWQQNRNALITAMTNSEWIAQ